MKLRIGLIGLGTEWDVRHGPALRALSDRYEVRAVCEEVALRGEQVARQFGAVRLDGFQTLLQRSDIDAVLILSGRWFGPLPILAACAYGKAIYCGPEWDYADDQLSSMQQQVDDAGIAFMADLPRRVAPATVRLKELIATRLGKPRMLFCHHRHAFKPSMANGKQSNPHSPEASINRELLQIVDWCQYVVGGHATSVNGFRHQASGVAGTDYQTLNLDFSAAGQLGNGPMAQISCGTYMPTTWPEAISFRPPAALQVCCERGVAFVDLPSTLVWFDEAGRHMESLDNERPAGELLLWQFHRQVTRFVRDTSSLNDVFSALKVLALARQSFNQARRIFVAEE
jgi:predicted dehydrogenase